MPQDNLKQRWALNIELIEHRQQNLKGLKYFIIKKPIIGRPSITLPIDDISAFLNEKTLKRVRAIPKDINIKKNRSIH